MQAKNETGREGTSSSDDELSRGPTTAPLEQHNSDETLVGQRPLEESPTRSRRDGEPLGSSDVLSVIRRALELLPILFYFWGYWQLKDRLRVLLHRGALAFLSLGMLSFIADIAVSKGALPTLKYLKWTEEPLAMGLVILAGLIILLHSAHEVREKKSEHGLASAIWHLLNRDECRTEADLFKRSLPHIAKAFDTPVHRVSIWIPSGNRLVLKDHGLHEPTPVGAAVLKELPLEKGVAGRVFFDGRPRYVPRVCFPFNNRFGRRCSWRFLHALVFDLRRGGATGNGNHPTTPPGGLVELNGNRVDFNSVVLTERVTIDCLHAFVAVPISAFRKGETPQGVLCIDFAKTDPLRTDQVRSAATFGLLLALDLERIRKLRDP